MGALPACSAPLPALWAHPLPQAPAPSIYCRQGGLGSQLLCSRPAVWVQVSGGEAGEVGQGWLHSGLHPEGPRES